MCLLFFKTYRSVPGIFHKTVETSQGIALWRFSGEPKGLANATVNPDNIGFCTPTRENCLGAGLVNISNCQSGKVNISVRSIFLTASQLRSISHLGTFIKVMSSTGW
jgi:hypothetical protein